MDVTFTHPMDSSTFKATIESTTTGQECIDGLVEDSFIPTTTPDHPYSLINKRTGMQILPAMSMEQAAVQDKDVISVQRAEKGATRWA